MTRCRVRFAVLAMLALVGCDRAPDPPACPPPTLASPTQSVSPPVTRLPPESIEGIWPPAWKKGDAWRVTSEMRYQPGATDHRSAVFRVVAASDGPEGVYQVEVTRDGDKSPSHAVTFRRDDFSVARLRDTSDEALFHREIYMSGTWPIFAFPIVPAGLVNPAQFPPQRSVEYGFDRGEWERWQLILTHGDAMTIELVARQRYAFSNFRIIMEWRRGDPWWSSVDCFRMGAVDDILPKPLIEGQSCHAWLERDVKDEAGKK